MPIRNVIHRRSNTSYSSSRNYPPRDRAETSDSCSLAYSCCAICTSRYTNSTRMHSGARNDTRCGIPPTTQKLSSSSLTRTQTDAPTKTPTEMTISRGDAIRSCRGTRQQVPAPGAFRWRWRNSQSLPATEDSTPPTQGLAPFHRSSVHHRGDTGPHPPPTPCRRLRSTSRHSRRGATGLCLPRREAARRSPATPRTLSLRTQNVHIRSANHRRRPHDPTRTCTSHPSTSTPCL